MPNKFFSMRQYVLLSRQKDIFQNWPFAEKYLRLCLKYGENNVLPPLELRGLPEKTSISDQKKKDSYNAGDYNHKVSVESAISAICEKVKLMSLSCKNSHKQEKVNHSDAASSPDVKSMNNNLPVNLSKMAARKGKRSRKWRRKMKSLIEIFATAKHRTLEEADEMLECCTSDNNIIEDLQKFDQFDFGCYCGSKSEITDDGADYKNGLSKRRRVLKSWSKSSSSSYKATVITKNRSRGCNRKTKEIYGPESAFELHDTYIY